MENIYKVVWDNEEENGTLYGVSLVGNPANKFEFIQLSEQEDIKLQVEVPQKKKHLAGVVLVPNQKIRRYTKEKGEFDVIFEADTIEKLAHNVFIQGYHKNSWINHKETNRVQGSAIVESWIVEDPEKDKSVALGMGVLPKGTWCIIMKLSDAEWDKYVETGQVKGFSIDSFLSLERMLFSEESNNSIKDKLKLSMEKYVKKFLKFMEDNEKEEIKMITIPMEEGEALEVEALEEGMVVTRDGEVFADSEFTFEGKQFSTDSEGKLIVEKEEEADVEIEVDASEDKEEMDAKKDEEEMDTIDMRVDLSDEEDKKNLFNLINKDKELDSVLASKYEISDEDKIEMAINLAKENEDVMSKLSILFSEERKAFESKLEAKDAEILKLKEELEETPNDKKVKAEIKMSASKGSESTLDALARISKSNK